MSKFAEGTPERYREDFATGRIDKGEEQKVRNGANTILKNKSRYAAVASVVFLGAQWTDEHGKVHDINPADLWWVIGCIHMKEASCDFSGVLHNGEKIIGTGRKTTIVPKGRGPFDTWEEAAIDAMRGETLGQLKNYELGILLRALERYNGTGYISGAGRAEMTPYLWACTTINDDRGKYVRDGQFDPNASVQSAPGICAYLYDLMARGEVFVPRFGMSTGEPQAPKPPPGTTNPGHGAGSEEDRVRAALTAAFSGLLSPKQIDSMIERQKMDRPGRWPRYWGVCDFRIHSAKHRFFVLDRHEMTLLSTFCAHGIGSEGATDDGMADTFSNRPGSLASSLGLYRVMETYTGKHGTSCRIDGLEPSNSNARARAVVIHGADYVSEATIKKYGRAGRSEGCFALPNDVVQKVIGQLKGGSLLLAIGNE